MQFDEIHAMGKFTVPLGEGRDKTYISLEAGVNIVSKENSKEGRDAAFKEAWQQIEEQVNSQIEVIIPSVMGNVKSAKGE